VDEDIWNFDEAGFRIGCSKSTLAITNEDQRNVYVPSPDNRETLTSIECINGGAKHIPSFVVVAAKSSLQNGSLPIYIQAYRLLCLKQGTQMILLLFHG
jgi:hypothetical protein